METTRKVVITCAPTGSFHAPSMSPYLPATPEEIGDAALAAACEGATVSARENNLHVQICALSI